MLRKKVLKSSGKEKSVFLCLSVFETFEWSCAYKLYTLQFGSFQVATDKVLQS